MRCPRGLPGWGGRRTIASLVLSAFLAIPAAQGQTAPSAEGGSGFCADGVYYATSWPDGKRPAGLETWGSFCKHGDDDVGRVESQKFWAPSILNLYLAGYPGMPGRKLTLSRIESGEEMELRPPGAPGLKWQLSSFPLPPEWTGRPVKLIAEDRATGYGGWFGFSQPLLPAFSLMFPVIATNGQPSGFCPEGAYPGTIWPSCVRPPGITTWGSFCQPGMAATGWMASRPAVAGDYLTLYVAGFHNMPGIRLAVQDMKSEGQLLLDPSFPAGDVWHQVHVRMPVEWRGRPVRVLAQDQAAGPRGWIAFSDPAPQSLGWQFSVAAKALGLVLLFAALLFLPCAAASLLAAHRGIQDALDLTAIALAALGLTGYGAFWIYLFSRRAGMLFSYAAVSACYLAVVYLLVQPSRVRLLPVKQLVMPGILVVLASGFIVSLGLLRGGADAPLEIPPVRFRPPDLVGDHVLPKILADGVYAGHIPRPIMSDWLSSDRPPLQAGNALWAYAWTRGGRDLEYLVLSVVLQCSFLAGLWGLLSASKISRGCQALAVVMCFFTGFTYVQGFYTWPKLYPVAYLLIIAAYLFTDRYHLVRGSAVTGALIGVLTALAMLCHGGSMFAICGLAGSMLLSGRIPGRRFVLAMAGAAMVTYAPWTLYQKVFDPPGDRLLKFHLTGTQEPRPDVGLARLLVTNYGRLGLGNAVKYKITNFRLLGDSLQPYMQDLAAITASPMPGEDRQRADTADRLRRMKFHFLIPCLGLASLGPVALLAAALSKRRKRAEFAPAFRLWLCTAITIVVWCLLIFGPNGTVVHVGSYFTVIAAIAASCLAFWTVHPGAALAAAGLEILWNAIVYFGVAAPAPLPGDGLVTAALSGPLNAGFAVACVLSAGGIFLALIAFVRGPAGLGRTCPPPQQP